jgi:hypothetical protein
MMRLSLQEQAIARRPLYPGFPQRLTTLHNEANRGRQYRHNQSSQLGLWSSKGTVTLIEEWRLLGCYAVWLL